MIKVLTCVTGAHDWRLVWLAASVCLLSVGIAFDLYARLPARNGPVRTARLGVVGVIAGSGVWTTHFVAMLAFEPALRTGYDPGPTLASLIVVVAFSTLAFTLAAQLKGWRSALVGGALLGGGVAVMHFTGMMALRTQGWILWNPAYVIASLALGVSFSVAALAFARPARR